MCSGGRSNQGDGECWQSLQRECSKLVAIEDYSILCLLSIKGVFVFLACGSIRERGVAVLKG